MYDQGMLLYETNLTGKGEYIFNVTFRDFMLVYIDDKFNGTMERKKVPNYLLKVKC